MNDFKILEEFPNYEIYKNGDIFNTKTNFKLCGTIENNGYRRFSLSNKDGKRKNMRHHRLLAQTFLENPNNYKQVDHIDNNKLNNNLENLRFCSQSLNSTNREHYSHKKNGAPEKRFKYVNWHKRDKQWEGNIAVNGKNIYIGTSDNDEELYLMCLEYLYSIFKDNEFYSQKIQEDLIYYKIKD